MPVSSRQVGRQRHLLVDLVLMHVVQLQALRLADLLLWKPASMNVVAEALVAELAKEDAGRHEPLRGHRADAQTASVIQRAKTLLPCILLQLASESRQNGPDELRWIDLGPPRPAVH